MSLLREAFIVRLKPGCLAEWRRRHEVIWPELVEQERLCGVVQMTIFEADPFLFVYSEVLEPSSWDKLIQTDAHKRWVEYMADLSASSLEDSTVSRTGLPEVFHRVYIPEQLASRELGSS